MTKTVLKFDLDKVRAQFDHAQRSDDFRPSFTEQFNEFGDKCFGMDYDDIEAKLKGKIKPALWLVKDEGIYLMSNGKGDDRPDVVYAKGFNPKERDRMDVWDDARAAVGGDDFAELIDHDTSKSFCEFDTKSNTLEIVFSKNSLEFRIPVRS